MWICADLIRRTPVTQSFLDELPPRVSAEICTLKEWNLTYIYHYSIQIPWLYVIVYWENGNIYLEENYKDGKLDGFWKYYYENGNICQEKNYKDGKMNGPWKHYFDNGNILREGNYDDDIFV